MASAQREPSTSNTWIVLGAGSILQQAGYGCAGYALFEPARDALTLFDCGPGTLRSLVNLGYRYEQIERIVITHFHLDHVLDLFALGYARRNPAFEAGDLEIVGPTGLQAFIEKAGRALGGVQRGFDGVRYLEVDPGEKIATKEFEHYTLSTTNTHHSKLSLAWRVDVADGGSACYSGDSGEETGVAELARDVELFCCECSFPEEQAQPNHLHPRGAARLAARAPCKRLLLSHFYPAMSPNLALAEAKEVFKGPIELARDGSHHELGLEVAPGAVDESVSANEPPSEPS
jgi:ribonuclease BN (tRNA processing enzyme)